MGKGRAGGHLCGLLTASTKRIARSLKAESRFWAELDSLADSLSAAPALILFLWSLGAICRALLASCGAGSPYSLRAAPTDSMRASIHDQPHNRPVS
ncbi:MAG: hypothetical protein H6914_09730 [Novosphingobium sp.]|nr:hypothetical protein [Novosphingobium sp.]